MCLFLFVFVVAVNIGDIPGLMDYCFLVDAVAILATVGRAGYPAYLRPEDFCRVLRSWKISYVVTELGSMLGTDRPNFSNNRIRYRFFHLRAPLARLEYK